MSILEAIENNAPARKVNRMVNEEIDINSLVALHNAITGCIAHTHHRTRMGALGVTELGVVLNMIDSRVASLERKRTREAAKMMKVKQEQPSKTKRLAGKEDDGTESKEAKKNKTKKRRSSRRDAP